MNDLRFAVLGAGFWSRYQLAAWQEVGGVECVAVCDAVRAKAEARACEFSVPRVYESAAELLRQERLDFVDIISSPDTHRELVHLAAQRRLPVICQKPMAPSLADAERMVEVCRDAGVPFFVHENWRWQTPLRRLKQVLDEGQIGIPFRARRAGGCGGRRPKPVSSPGEAQVGRASTGGLKSVGYATDYYLVADGYA